MPRFLTLFLILIINLFFALSSKVILAADRQLEFAGVKLGTRVDSLGIKLDEDRARYRHKDKYHIYGYFNQPGHPISMIFLSCKDANAGEKVAGIGCDDAIETITKKFGSVLFEMCQSIHVLSRIDESTPSAFYNPDTNQFWSFDQKTKKVRGIGIALPEHDGWQKCKKRFTSNELSQVRLGLSAPQLLGVDFDKVNGRYGLTELMSIEYDTKKKGFPITEITNNCRSEGQVSKFKIRGFGCGERAEDILGSLKLEIEVVCSPIIFDGTQRIWRYYIPKTKEYWSFDDQMTVDALGFAEGKDPMSQPCDPAKVRTAGLLGDIKTAVQKVAYPEDKWELIVINSKYIIQIDSKSIKKKGNSYKLWAYTRFNYGVCYEFCNIISRDGKYATSVKEYFEFNCEDEQYRLLAYEYFHVDDYHSTSLTLFDANKNLTSSPERTLVESGNRIGEWHSAVDGDMQKIAKRICR